MAFKRKSTGKVAKRSTGKVAKSSTGGRWMALQVGDLVDVVAPGFCPTDDEVEAGVKFLESWGLQARLPADLFGADVIASNTDEKRLKHLTHALLAKDSAAVWCLRGGYGAIRLVPGLMKLKKPKHTKVLLGLSDVTTIQQWLEQKWNWPSLQAPLLDRLGRTVEASLVREGKARPLEVQVEELRRIVFGETSTVLFEGLRRLGQDSGGSKRLKARGFRRAVVRGKMTGGNLVTFASAIGTKIHPSTVGKIVYFEDIGERGYRVDRLLEHLVQAEIVTNKTKAIVFGEFVAGLENDGTSKVPSVLERFAIEWGAANNVPVYTGVTSGHGLNQRVVPLATEAVLDLNSGSLEIETAVQFAKEK